MKILRAKIKKAVNNLLGPVSKTWRQMPEKSTHSSSSPGRLDAVIEELYFSEPEEISKTIKKRKRASQKRPVRFQIVVNWIWLMKTAQSQPLRRINLKMMMKVSSLFL